MNTTKEEITIPVQVGQKEIDAFRRVVRLAELYNEDRVEDSYVEYAHAILHVKDILRLAECDYKWKTLPYDDLPF